ncbi:MAG: hypothetical protein V1793_13575 [Pseudomonadota bacterium]
MKKELIGDLPVHRGLNLSSELLTTVILGCFGILVSITYWRYLLVPNSDFPSFLQTGNELLNLQMPSSFKRAPLLGLIQAIVSRFVGGDYPGLVAGCLINAMMYPLIIVMFYLIAKRFIDNHAAYFALIASINPDVLNMLTEPLVETSLLWAILATFILMFKGSPWAFLLACIASLLRYEGVFLIGIVFVWFFISSPARRDRFVVMIQAAIAVIPLAVWLAMTFTNWDHSDPTHYIKEAGSQDLYSMLVKYMSLTWHVGFSNLLTYIESVDGKAVASSHFFIIIPGTVGLLSSLYWSFKYRRLDSLLLILFLAAYLAVHIWHGFIFDRFCATIAWIPLMLCWYGLSESSVRLTDKINKPVLIQTVAPAILITGACSWIGYLLPEMMRYSVKYSEASRYLPYMVVTAVVAVFSVNFQRTRKFPGIISTLAVVSIVLLMTASNQFSVATTLGDGKRDLEFKLLADWYRQHAKPGEKLATSMPHVVSIFDAEHKEFLVSTGSIKGDNPFDYLKDLVEQNIRYIAWDSRLGLCKRDRFYILWGMNKIADLSQPRDIGPFRFLSQIKNKNSLINIFEVVQP